MDAAKLLKSQGWRGLGHSLHHSDDSVGLARPILFSQKQNVLGIGTNTHRTSDMWWMDAFDQQLKGMKSKADGRGIEKTIKSGQLNQIQGRHTKYGIIGGGGLYSGFVRGGLLAGTIEAEDTSTSEEGSDDDESEDTPPTSEDPESGHEKILRNATKKESKEERRIRKEAKQRRKQERAAKRARKAEKRAVKAEKQARRQRKEERRKYQEFKEERRKRKLERRSKRARLNTTKSNGT